MLIVLIIVAPAVLLDADADRFPGDAIDAGAAWPDIELAKVLTQSSRGGASGSGSRRPGSGASP